MLITKDGLFWLKELGSNGSIFQMGFTREGMRRYGTLFVCEPLVSRSQEVNQKSKLFAVEGMQRLDCPRSPVNGVVYKVDSKAMVDPSEITPDTPIITIKGTPNALSIV